MRGNYFIFYSRQLSSASSSGHYRSIVFPFQGITISAVAQASAVIQSGALTEVLRIFEAVHNPVVGLIE